MFKFIKIGEKCDIKELNTMNVTIFSDFCLNQSTHPAEMKSTYFLLSHKELPIPEAQKPLKSIWTSKGEFVVVGFFHILVYFLSYWPKFKIISRKKIQFWKRKFLFFNFHLHFGRRRKICVKFRRWLRKAHRRN